MYVKIRNSVSHHLKLIIRAIRIFSSFQKPVLFSIVLLSLTEALTPIINIYFSSLIVNELTGNQDLNRLVILVSLTICINLLTNVFQRVAKRWRSYCCSNNWFSSHMVLANKVLSMDYDTMEDPHTQKEYLHIRQNEMGTGFGLSGIEEPIYQSIHGIIMILFSILLALPLFTQKVPDESPYKWINSTLVTSIIVFFVATPIFLTPHFNTIGGKVFTQTAKKRANANRFFLFYFSDILTDILKAKDIRIYNQKRIIEAHTLNDESVNWSKNCSWDKDYKHYGRLAAYGVLVTLICNSVIYAYIVTKAYAGAYGIGSIILYGGAIMQFGFSCTIVLTMVGKLVNNNSFLKKWFEFIDIPNGMSCGTQNIDKTHAEFEFEFKNVSFRYPSSSKNALSSISLKLKSESRIAIVGENGSGKTTLIKLLCRLYDPSEGVILLNGVDIRKYNYYDYLSFISVVFQDFKLLPFTLGQNVATNLHYDKDRVIKALDTAGFSNRLLTMPAGLDTYLYSTIEDGGVDISSGEAQKIALARAIYKESPLIVLDEPTAALDPVAEFEVYSRMNEIVGSKAAVFISHRLSSCRFCDDIIVLHNGRLVQYGNHDNLIQEVDGKYNELWNSQAQYYQ